MFAVRPSWAGVGDGVKFEGILVPFGGWTVWDLRRHQPAELNGVVFMDLGRSQANAIATLLNVLEGKGLRHRPGYVNGTNRPAARIKFRPAS